MLSSNVSLICFLDRRKSIKPTNLIRYRYKIFCAKLPLDHLTGLYSGEVPVMPVIAKQRRAGQAKKTEAKSPGN